RLHRRAGLALALGDPVELAERIRKAAGHGEDPAGFVLQHQCRALHGRAHTKLRLAAARPAGGIRLRPGFAVSASALDGFTLDDMHINHVIKPEAAPNRAAPPGERPDASVP